MAFPIPLPHRVTVESLTSSKDTHGGNVKTWATVAADVACQITQGSGSRPTRFDQQPVVGRYTVTGYHESLGRDDTRYTVTVGPQEGKTLRVLGVVKKGPVAYLDLDRFFTATCEEVNT